MAVHQMACICTPNHTIHGLHWILVRNAQTRWFWWDYLVTHSSYSSAYCIANYFHVQTKISSDASMFILVHIIWASAWYFQQCGMCDQQSLRSACAYAQSDRSPCCSLEYSIIVKLLVGQHLEFLCLERGCRGSSGSARVGVPHCWRSHVTAHL